MKRQQPPSALGRPIEAETYITNRLILIVSPIVALIAVIYTLYINWDLWQAAQAGFWGYASTFAAWSISRELDHDNDWSAFLAVAISVISVFYFGLPA